jgi:PKD repeat protein
MPRRVSLRSSTLPFVAVCGLAAWGMLACSSGLEGAFAGDGVKASAAAPSTNLRFAFDPCLALTQPIQEFDVAGGVFPTSTGEGQRPVVFFAFTTAAPANNADGMGTPLDPDAPADTNGASDVFVAAVDSASIDTRAFSYAIAGKMRHPRCTTCHQMNVDVVANPNALPPTAFLNDPSVHAIGGVPPLNDTSQENCKDCHFEDWFAPSANFDLRDETTQQLFQRAQIAPTGLAEHFLSDIRVTWALDNGELPFGEPADDDHDGIDEPEDHDGVGRFVPGGRADFERRFEEWEASGLKFDSAEDAVQRITLASRSSAGNTAGNAAASQPALAYAANPAYVHGVSNPNTVPVGFVHVAYTSNATNMVGGTANGVSDVFRTTLNAFQLADGMLDLRFASTAYVSVDAFGGNSNGASNSPSIGGATGQRVAFVSQATDLLIGFNDQNGAGTDVFVRDVQAATTDLASHFPGNDLRTGNAASGNPDLSSDGAVVAFESAAADLVVGDTNGVTDVFHAAFPLFDAVRSSVSDGGAQGNGGPSRNPSVHSYGGGDVRVAFESEKTDLVAELPLSTCNVFLRDTRNGGSTRLVNRIVSPEGSSLPTATDTSGTPVPVDAFDPVIGGAGDIVLFSSEARDLDFVRPFDDNRASDVFLADLGQLDANGFVLPYALSVGADAHRGNGDSHTPRVADFVPATDMFPLGVAVFATRASNLGNSDPGDVDGDGVPEFDNHLVLMLREGATVIADFEKRDEKIGPGDPVRFESLASGSPTTFAWDFGDGATSSERNPTHTYTSPGLYTVSLAVSGELGSDTRTRTDYVEVLGPVVAVFTSTKDISESTAPTQLPAVDVPNATTVVGAIDDANPASRLLFDFDSALSTQCPETFTWSVVEVNGMGQPIGAPMTFSNAQTALDVAFASTGLFDVRLSATGPGGSGEASQRIEVYQRVTSSFTASVLQGPAPLEVDFTSTSTGDIASYLWGFDPGSSTQASPQNVQFAAGVHDVVLTTTGLGGDQVASSTVQIVALGDITANFSGNPEASNEQIGLNCEAVAGAGGVNVDFNNTTVGTQGVPLFYRWDFGVATAVDPTLEDPQNVLYAPSGENVTTFTVRLVAKTSAPASVTCTGSPSTECDTVQGSVRLFPALTVDFTNGSSFKLTSLAPPHTVNFDGTVTGDGPNTNPAYRWFRSTPGGLTANIQFSTSLDPQFTFTDPGTYRVRLECETDGPGGSRQTVSSSSKIVNVTASTFTDFHSQAIVASGCSGCHDGVGGALPGVFNLTGTASQVRARLVNITSVCNAGWVRVEPFDPSDSIIHDLLQNGAGNTASGCESMRSNLVGSTTDVNNHVAVLRSWILGGALNN